MGKMRENFPDNDIMVVRRAITKLYDSGAGFIFICDIDNENMLVRFNEMTTEEATKIMKDVMKDNK